MNQLKWQLGPCNSSKDMAVSSILSEPGHSAGTLQLRLPLVGGEISALGIFHTSGPGRWQGRPGWPGWQGQEVGVEAGHPLLGRRNSCYGIDIWHSYGRFFSKMDQHGIFMLFYAFYAFLCFFSYIIYIDKWDDDELTSIVFFGMDGN